MGRSYSLDLRRRVVSRVDGGRSRRGAAADLQVDPVVLGQAGGAPSPHRHTGAAAARPPAWHRQARALSRLPDATREGNARYHHARAGR